MQFDNYIFDLYGTLIDVHTEEHEPKLWKQMSAYLKDNFGIKIKGDELHKLFSKTYDSYVKELKTIVKSDYPEIRVSWVWDDILWELGYRPGQKNGQPADIRRPHLFGIDNPKDKAPQHIARLCTYFRQTSTYHMCNYPQTHKMLKTLKANGKKIYLLSNAQRTYTEREIGTCRLAHFFDDIFISSDKLIMKPEPRYLQMLIDKHGLDKSKCVMIGNEIHSDIEIAKRCDISSILVQDGDFSEVLK